MTMPPGAKNTKGSVRFNEKQSPIRQLAGEIHMLSTFEHLLIRGDQKVALGDRSNDCDMVRDASFAGVGWRNSECETAGLTPTGRVSIGW